MNNGELISEISETDNCDKLIRILKKVDYDSLDTDTLAKIVSVLNNKKESDLYDLSIIKLLLLSSISFFGSVFVFSNFIAMVLKGIDAVPIVDFAKNLYICFTNNKDSLAYYFAQKSIKAFLEWVRLITGVSVLSGTFLSFFVSLSNKNELSPKKLKKLADYKGLVETIYKSKLEDLGKVLKKSEEVVVPNDELLISLNREVINYIGRMPDALKDRYTYSFNTMLAEYYRKCRECDTTCSDAPNFASDLKNCYFRELVANIKDFLFQIKPIVESCDNDILIANFNANLGAILEMPNAKEASDEFIKLSNKTLESFKTFDAVTLNSILDLISEYFLLMLNKQDINVPYLMYNINPYYYDAIAFKIREKLISYNSLEIIMNIQEMEKNKDLYSPFSYAEMLVHLYLKNVTPENNQKKPGELTACGMV